MGIAFKASLGQHFVPRRLRTAGEGEPRPVGDINRACLRIVALEMCRFDVDAANDARRAEPDDTPVVARLAASTRLPAIDPLTAICVKTVLPDRRRTRDQSILFAKEFIVGGD